MLFQEQRDEALPNEDSDRSPVPSPAISWRALAVLTIMLLVAPKSFLPTKLSEPVTLVVVAMLKALQWMMVMELVSMRQPISRDPSDSGNRFVKDIWCH